MMRSLFSGVSGLKAHQTMMDVVGDNISNINTAGFKGSRVVFSDTLSQVMRNGNAATDQIGGTNSAQIGLGVRTAGIDVVNTQGSVQATGRPTDVAIQEEGYFIVRSGAEQLYTRAGSFGFDDLGDLADPTGAIVQGWPADPVTGEVNATGPAQDVKIPLGQTIAPEATTIIRLGGNLSSNAVAGTAAATIATPGKVFDSLGASNQVRFEYTKVAGVDNQWKVDVFDATDTVVPPTSLMGGGVTLAFLANGSLDPTSPAVTFTLPGKNGADPTVVTADLGVAGTAGALTQFGSSSGPTANGDGAGTGYMRSYAISDSGTVSGSFSNGEVKVLGQLAMASFTNPGGLIKAGSSHLRASEAAGDVSVGLPGEGGRGKLSAGYLEGSNVDLAQEFTQLMIAQRGFQANSKIVSTSDEMLGDLINLKR